MVQLRAVAVETISALLMKPSLIVLYLRHGAPHRSGDLDPFWTTGPTSVDFSNGLALSDPGK